MKKEVSEARYAQLRALQKQNGLPFTEHIQGSRRTLIVFNKIVCTTVVGGGFLDIGDIDDTQFVSFLACFKRGLYNNIKKKPELAFNKVEFKGVSRSKNRDTFSKIEVNDFYWNIDLVSAYWQIGFQLGYVSKSFFKKYQNNPSYKQVKRLAFSFLARQNYKDYIHNGNHFQIICDNTVHQQIYDNVRNELYKTITRAVELADTGYIDYNIDSISVTKDKKDQIVQFFLERGLEVKVMPVIKISNQEYKLKDRVRRF